jgi:hypothetical protein
MNTRFIKMPITQDDIDGADDESDRCPVVEAYRRAGFNVCLIRQTVQFILSPTVYKNIPMSFQISQFLDTFARGRYVEPGVFTVEVPDG